MSQNILSSYSTPTQVQKLIADTINISQELSGSGYQAVEENSQQIEFQIKNALKKQGMSIVVMTPKMSLQGNDKSSNVYAIDELQIMICEYVPVNRASTKTTYTTALDMGSYLAEYLAGRNSPLGYGALSFRDVEQGEDNGILVVKVNFATYVHGSYNEIVSPLDNYYTKIEVDAKLVALARSLSEEIENAGKSATWGNITGDMMNQQDLQHVFDNIDSKIEHAEDSIGTLQGKVNDNTSNIGQIFNDIAPTYPSTDAYENALAGAKATADFVNASINNFAAFYITMDAEGNAFPTKTSLLDATVFYSGGKERIPTQNDYCIVMSDGSHPNSLGEPTTRYTYQGTYPNGQWDFQYVVNNTSLTQAQINAINSGITSQKVEKIDNAATQAYVDNQISSNTSKFLYMHDSADGYVPSPPITKDGDFAFYRDYSNSRPQSTPIPGRPEGDYVSIIYNEIKRGYYDETQGRYMYKRMDIMGTDALKPITLSGSNVRWKPIDTIGTLFSEWTYADTLSARSVISANVKSPFVQKNQLSNVNVFSGKYEDGSTFEISCLGTM